MVEYMPVDDDRSKTVNQPGVADHAASSDANGDGVPDWLIPSRLYDVLKWLGLIVLPALAVLVKALGPVWGFGELADQIATSVTAVGLFLGVVIGASAIKGATSAK